MPRQEDDDKTRELYDAARELGVDERTAREFIDGKSDGKDFSENVSSRIHDIDNGNWQYEDMDKIERYNRAYDEARQQLEEQQYYDMKALDESREEAREAYERMENVRYPEPEPDQY